LLGSSNLTDGGLQSNREATICVDQTDDLMELRSLFNELWKSALVLTAEKLQRFTVKHGLLTRGTSDLDALIEDAVGKSEPTNSNVESSKKTKEDIFLEELRREVDRYRKAFGEVTQLLQENQFRRPELENVGPANETNRFLNWVRVTYASGEGARENVPLRSPVECKTEIVRLGREWTQTDHNKIPKDYIGALHQVRRVFGSREAIEDASKDQLMDGLLSIHAFHSQHRYIKGGTDNLPEAFWSANNKDIAKVKRTLTYLVHGGEEFIQRLHDVLYDQARKLVYFGEFCALEVYGTVKPEDCPPMNGRIAKALRFLGFDVRGE
jgi:hypothetical protein